MGVSVDVNVLRKVKEQKEIVQVEGIPTTTLSNSVTSSIPSPLRRKDDDVMQW